MKALILAAGFGTRLGHLTTDRPKPMLPIGGRPLLDHLVRLVRAHGVRDVAVNLHHHGQVIRDHLGDGSDYDVSIVYSHEPVLLGTAGAVHALRHFLDEPFFVLYGDVLTDEDLTSLAAWHRATHADLTMTLYRVEDPTRAGVVEAGPDGRVTRFQEKPSAAEVFSDLASTGVLIAQPSVLASIPADRPADIGHDLLPALLSEGAAVYGRLASGYVMDIGGVERYRRANHDACHGRLKLPMTPTAGVA